MAPILERHGLEVKGRLKVIRPEGSLEQALSVSQSVTQGGREGHFQNRESLLSFSHEKYFCLK